MAKLENVPVDALQAALERAAGKKETQRLMVAILYKQGPSVPMIAEWFDLPERTIYDWLDRLERRPIEAAIADDAGRGRPPKLDSEDRIAFEAILENQPTASGYDRSAWTTALARIVLREEFDVEYSRRHVQRLLRDAGLSPRREVSDRASSSEQVWIPQ